MPVTKPKTTKIAKVKKMLARRQGATMTQLQKSTGWLPHSVRAVLTGLRKRGYEIIRDKNEAGVTVYRIRAGAGE